MKKAFLSAVGLCLALCGYTAGATETTSVRVGATQAAVPTQANTQEAARQMDALNTEARMWGLTVDELTRAKGLAKFRASFTNVNLTPIEILGIHARNDAERKHYAELFARTLHDDTVRILAFQQAHAAAMQKLYPNEPVLDLPRKKLPRSFFGGGAE